MHKQCRSRTKKKNSIFAVPRTYMHLFFSFHDTVNLYANSVDPELQKKKSQFAAPRICIFFLMTLSSMCMQTTKTQISSNMHIILQNSKQSVLLPIQRQLQSLQSKSKYYHFIQITRNYLNPKHSSLLPKINTQNHMQFRLNMKL